MTRKTQRHGRIFFIAALGLAPPGLALAPAAPLAASSVDKLQDFPLEQVQITDTCQLIGQSGLLSSQLRFGEWK
jgi:hypothetical protein